jgi:hypothetical protein
MFTLATDVQKIIMEFLEPQEIKEIYETCKNSKIMFEELTKHTNFIVSCKRIMPDEELKWFKLKNIKLKLLEKYIIRNGEDQFWYTNGKNHRDNDLPAIIFKQGTKIWYKNGNVHRDNDLPAIIYSCGDQHWYKNDLKHRDNDLPAIIQKGGNQTWYQNGKCHRDNDLPAIICPNGTQFWYQNGKCHRDNDLPAIILINGKNRWFKNGFEYYPVNNI